MVWDEKLWIRLKSASHVSDVICRSPFDFSYCLDPPMLRTEASVVYTGLGQRFYLACHVSAEPPADVTWTRQNRHVHVSRRLPRVELVRREDTWFLFLNNVTSEDFGEYVCRANNTIGTASTNVIVVGVIFLAFLRSIFFLTDNIFPMGRISGAASNPSHQTSGSSIFHHNLGPPDQ